MARMSLSRLLREPLLHFVVLGAAIFVTYHVVSRGAAVAPQDIVVTPGTVENLVVTFERTWQRPPTDEEREGLIREYVRDEVAYREAMALGLDRDDTVIRRRLRQKLDFISEDVAAQVTPSDAELRAYFDAHPADFATERVYTFDHVFLSPERHGANLASDAEALRVQLSRPDHPEFTDLGDPFLLPHQYEKIPADMLRGMFGDEFVARLATLPIGEWTGPIASGYGEHVVLLRERSDGSPPSFDEARADVEREWENARRLEANERFYQGLLTRYRVVVEPARTDGPAGAGR